LCMLISTTFIIYIKINFKRWMAAKVIFKNTIHL